MVEFVLMISILAVIGIITLIVLAIGGLSQLINNLIERRKTTE